MTHKERRKIHADLKAIGIPMEYLAKIFIRARDSRIYEQTIQSLWHEFFEKPIPLLVVLCGEDKKSVENQVFNITGLSKDSPVYNQRHQ